VLVTGPYFHDGSQETLWDVIDHYNKGAGLQNPYLDQDIEPLALTESDIDDLVAFLASLTSAGYREQGVKELSRQRELSRTTRPQRDTARAFGPKPSGPSRPPLDPYTRSSAIAMSPSGEHDARDQHDDTTEKQDGATD
jgi:cytochrome c peroxidase